MPAFGDVLRDTPMPERIAARPRDARGFPLPYIAGGGDFRLIDQPLWDHVVRNHLCAMCAVKLDYWIAFIGNIDNVEERAFIDPGMHVDCARYSIAVCPFLSREHARRSKRALPDAADYILPTLSERPDKMALYVTRSYEVVRSPIGNPYPRVIRPAPARSLEWF